MSAPTFTPFLNLPDEASFLKAVFSTALVRRGASLGANKILEQLGREWICDV
jgi:glutaminase